PKSIEAVAAVYGTLRAGAAYVPLDPRAPAPRVATVAADCGLAALVATPSLAAALMEELPADRRPRLVVAVGAEEATPLPVPAIAYEDATSGTHEDPAVPIID